MAKSEINKDELKALAEEKATEARNIIMMAATTFPNGEPTSTGALFARAHSLLAVGERYAWSFSQVLATMDNDLSIKLPVTITRVELEENTQRGIVYFQSTMGEPKKDDNGNIVDESARTERIDNAEGKRVYDLAVSLVGKKASLWKYVFNTGKTGKGGKVAMIGNIVPDSFRKTSGQTSSAPAASLPTEPAPAAPVETPQPAPAPTPTADPTPEAPAPTAAKVDLPGNSALIANGINSGKDLLAVGAEYGYDREQIKAKTAELLGELVEGATRTAEEYRGVARILVHEATVGPITEEVALDSDSIEGAYNEVYLNAGRMANRLEELGMEQSEIKALAGFLPLPEEGKSRTNMQVQAVYLACLDQIQQEMND